MQRLVYTYSQLVSALKVKEADNPVGQIALQHLPTTDPSGGAGFYVYTAYARFLGLSTASGGTELVNGNYSFSSSYPFDSAIILNTNYETDFGQDAIDALTHELSETEMGRVGSSMTAGQSWTIMDLFRYNAAGQYDTADGRDGKAAYFSYNGGQTTSASATLSFFNNYNTQGAFSSGDSDDFNYSSGGNSTNPNSAPDIFGPVSTVSGLSQTDDQILGALGWSSTPTLPSVPGVAVPGSVHLADVNADHKSDLIYETSDNTFLVMTSTGTGFNTQQAWVQEGGPNNLSDAQFADLNGDGKADLIYQGADNRFWVSLSTGSSFGPAQLWTGEGGPANTWEAQYADVTGDGKADLIYQGTDNRFWVSTSTGTGFAGAQLWAGEGGSSYPGGAQYADLTGNGKSDLIYQGADNRFWVSLSTGSSFGPAQLWTGEGGPANTWEAQYADVTGDHKADLIYQGTDNRFWVSTSTGTGFTGAQLWATMPGPAVPGSAHLADLNGDGKADLIYEAPDNTFWVALSTGSGFTTPQAWIQEGGPNNLWAAHFADVNGDGKADLVYQGADNQFWVSLSTGTGFAPPQLEVLPSSSTSAGPADNADTAGSAGPFVNPVISDGTLYLAPGAVVDGPITFADGSSGTLFDADANLLPDTVVGFSEGTDHLTFAGANSTSEAAVVSSASVVNGNTVLSFPDHTSIVMVGITRIDTGIFA